MNKLVGLLLLFAPFALFGQQETDKSEKKSKPHKMIGIGIKAGFDFSNITNASMVNASSRTGYHFGLLIGTGSKHLLGSRTELIYSRRGYNYKDSASAGSINLDYIGLAQLLTINITKYVQIQIGAQTSYLLTVKADSSQPSTGNASADKALAFYNRFDYGYGGGVEIHPFVGLLVGARYNISLNNLYKQPTSFSTSGGTPSFYPSASSISLKNNVIQVFVGYRF